MRCFVVVGLCFPSSDAWCCRFLRVFVALLLACLLVWWLVICLLSVCWLVCLFFLARPLKRHLGSCGVFSLLAFIFRARALDFAGFCALFCIIWCLFNRLMVSFFAFCVCMCVFVGLLVCFLARHLKRHLGSCGVFLMPVLFFPSSDAWFCRCLYAFLRYCLLFARLMVSFLYMCVFVGLFVCLFVFLTPTSKKTPWLMRCLFVAGLRFPSWDKWLCRLCVFLAFLLVCSLFWWLVYFCLFWYFVEGRVCEHPCTVTPKLSIRTLKPQTLNPNHKP